MAVAEKKAYDVVPGKLESYWFVNFLSNRKFTPAHVKVLRAKFRTSDKVLSSLLHLAPKTFVSYTNDASKIKIDTQEHVLMLIALFKHGSEVFGSEEAFTKWLDMPNLIFDNKKPIEFLNTISGIRFIDDRLISMEYGDNV